MAKPAKSVDEINDKIANKFIKDVLAHYENIESARGRYAQAARKERDGILGILEGLAAKGVSQRAAKTNIKIVRALQKVKAWVADLEAEDRKMAERLAKLQKDKKQLLLFGELPKVSKPKKDNVVQLADAWEDSKPVAAE